MPVESLYEPFPSWATSNLAEALGVPGVEAGRQAIVVYGAVTIVGAMSWGPLFHVLASNPDLLDDPSHAHGFATDRAGSIIGIATTAGAAAVGWIVSPTLGTALLALTPVIFAVASEGDAQRPAGGPPRGHLRSRRQAADGVHPGRIRSLPRRACRSQRSPTCRRGDPRVGWLSRPTPVGRTAFGRSPSGMIRDHDRGDTSPARRGRRAQRHRRRAQRA